jgi:titin
MSLIKNNTESERIKTKNNIIVFSNFLKNQIAFSQGLFVKMLPIIGGSGGTGSSSELVAINYGKNEISTELYNSVVKSSEIPSTNTVVVPVVPPANIPKPTNLTLISSTSTSATISFTPPSDGGSAITNYKYSLNAGTSFTAFSPAQTASPVIITGLTSGTSYQVQLQAVNLANNTSPSATFSLFSSPTNLSLISSTSTSATISFTPPSDSGSAITNYKYSLNAGTSFTAFSPVQTASPVIITGLTSGTSYQLQLQAINLAGNTSASATFSLFSGPTNLSLLSSTITSATISFTQPTNGGSAITNYNYSLDGGTTFTAFSPAQTASPVIITGLTNGTDYQVQLQAVNSVGNSLTSQTFSVFSGPTNLSLVSRTNSSVTFSFTAPNYGGNTITNYNYSLNGGTTFTAFSPAQTVSPVTVSGLISGTDYQIQIQASSSVGNTLASASLSVYSGPTNLSLLSSTYSSATISFTAPNNGGSAITNYKYSLDGGISFTSFSPAQTVSPVTVSGVINATAYQVQLQAVNLAGNILPSINLSVTPGTPCSFPGNLSIQSTTGTTATIAFVAPNNGGSAITNYKYSLNGGATSFTAFSPVQTATPVIVSGLTSGTTYQIQLQAINANGTGLTSSTLSVRPGVPLAPTSLNVTSTTSTTAVIAFTPQDNGGSAITNYKYSTDNGVTFTAFSPAQTTSPVTVSDLSVATTYKIQLQAINANGTGLASLSVLVTPGVPLAPLNVSLASVTDLGGNIRFNLNFTPNDTGGSDITSYKFMVIGDLNDSYNYSVTILQIESTTSPIAIDLVGIYPANYYYTLQLQGVNENGNGVFSSAILAPVDANNITNTKYSLPPLSVTLTSTTANSITFSYTIPSIYSGSVVYFIYISLDGGNTFSPYGYGGNGIAVITGLTTAKAYSIVLGLTDLVNSTKYYITSLPYSVIPGVPFAPTNLSISSSTDSSITLSFTPPSDTGGSTITGYNYSLDGGANFSSASWTSPATTIIISGISRSNNYNIVLQAVNVNGIGASSSSIAATTFILTAPTNVSLVSTTSTSATLSFTVPSYTGSSITGYNYSLDGGATFSSATWTSPATSLSISGLTVNTPYSIILQAVNANVNGASSTPVVITPGVPFAPTNVSVTSTTLTSVTLSFTAPSIDGGSSITGYKYSLNDGALTNATWTSPATTLTCSTGINNPPTLIINAVIKTFTIRIVAVNANGNSPYSSNVRVIPGAPTPPTALSCSSSTTNTATITFTPGDTGGNTIINYLYSLNGGDYDQLNPADSSSPITIPNVSPNVTYTISLKSINNKYYISEPSSVLSFTVPLCAPAAPTNLSVTSTTSTTAVIAFSAPNNGGSAITNYKYSTDGGTTFTAFSPAQTTSPVTVSNLTVANSYSIQLQAVNSNGTGSASSSISVKPGVPLLPTIIGVNYNTPYTTVYLNNTLILDTGGSDITSFYYSLNGAAYVQTTNFTNESNTRYNITITGLTSGTYYTLTIYASNANGAGPATSLTTSYFAFSNNGYAYEAMTIDIDAAGKYVIKYAPGGSAPPWYYKIGSGSVTSYSTVPTDLPSSASSQTIYSYYDAAGTKPIPIKLTNANTGITTYSAPASGATIATTVLPVVTAATRLTISYYFNNIIITATSGFAMSGYTYNNYQYSFDGSSYTAISPSLPITSSTTNPIIFTNLTNSQMTSFQGNQVFKLKYVITYDNIVGSTALTTATTSIAFKNNQLAFPTSLSYQWLTTTSVSISFTAPNTTYSTGAITNYLYSLDGGNTFTAFSPVQTTSPVTITELNSGSTYNIQLIALNSSGSSTASTSLLVVPPPPPPPMPQITNIFIQDNSINDPPSINVFFNNFPDINTIINYQYTTDGGSTFLPINSSVSTNNPFYYQLTSPVTIYYLSDINVLPIGSPITLQLQAVTASGSQPFSSPVTFTLGGTVPDPPTINFINFINNKLFVDFTPGNTYGVTTIIDYVYSIDGVSFHQAYKNTSPLIIPYQPSNPLFPSFKLAAICANGFVSQTQSYTYSNTPSAPTNLQATITRPSTLSISFTINTNGATITNYAYSLNGGTTFNGFSPAQTTSPLTITGLTAGNTYQIQVYAISDINSAASQTLNVAF